MTRSKYCLARILWALFMLLATAQVHAADLSASLVLGEKPSLQQRHLELDAGSYRIELADLFPLSPDTLSSALVMIVNGSKLITRIDLSRPFARFQLDSAQTLDLYVDGATASGVGSLRLSVRNETDVLFEDQFIFRQGINNPNIHQYKTAIDVSVASTVRFDLNDLSSLDFAVQPFDKILVQLTNSVTDSADGESKFLFWDVAALSPGRSLQHEFTALPGQLIVEIIAIAPEGEASLLDWTLRLDGKVVATEGLVYVPENPGQEELIGEFDLTSSGLLAVTMTVLSDNLDEFYLAVVNADDPESLIGLSRESLTSSAQRPAGHYRIVRPLPDASAAGLISVQVSFNNQPLLSKVISLGDFELLGEFQLSTDRVVNILLNQYLAPSPQPIDVRVVNATGLSAVLNDVQPMLTDVNLSGGQYQVWSKVAAATDASIYQLFVGTDTDSLASIWGVTGGDQLMVRSVPLTTVDTAYLDVTNFKAPDALNQPAIVLLSQFGKRLVEYTISPADEMTNHTANVAQAGPLEVVVFSQRQNGRATVVGYTLVTSAVPDYGAPDRSSNGAGKNKGSGGGISSFILYFLLGLKIAMGRRRNRDRFTPRLCL